MKMDACCVRVPDFGGFGVWVRAREDMSVVCIVRIVLFCFQSSGRKTSPQNRRDWFHCLLYFAEAVKVCEEAFASEILFWYTPTTLCRSFYNPNPNFKCETCFKKT